MTLYFQQLYNQFISVDHAVLIIVNVDAAK